MISHPEFSLYPEKFINHIIKPDKFERYEDKSARAIKIKGYRRGQSCFYFHTYSIIEDRLDCDDYTYELITYFEWTVAWQLDDGTWLQKKFKAHHPISKPSHQQLQDFAVVDRCECVV